MFPQTNKIFTLPKIINKISQTLNIANQILPLYKQAKPIINNAKTIISAFKEINIPKNSKINLSKDNNIVSSKSISQKNIPTFFQT